MAWFSNQCSNLFKQIIEIKSRGCLFMHAFIYIYLNTEYRYTFSVILSKVDLVTRSVYRYTKTHSVHIYRYQGLWRTSLWLRIFIFCWNLIQNAELIYICVSKMSKKQNEDIQSKTNKETKKMSNTDLTKNPGWTPTTWKYK